MSRFTGEYVANRKELHNAVRAAVGNRCIRCGHPQGDTFATRSPCDDDCTHPRDGKMRILTVHHLTGQKDDNRWWNLLALCQSCHLTIQGRVIPERPWLFEHSPWFIPYVCGFYASYYGGEDITREQADADPDRYLAMGQPWRTVPNAANGPSRTVARRSSDSSKSNESSARQHHDHALGACAERWRREWVS